MVAQSDENADYFPDDGTTVKSQTKKLTTMDSSGIEIYNSRHAQAHLTGVTISNGMEVD